MPELSFNEIVKAMDGSPENPVSGATYKSFHFDTRLINDDNTLFFAFKNEEGNDGHQYVGQLSAKKGCAAVVNHEFDAGGLTIPLIRVNDPLKAAQKLAKYVRQKYNDIYYVGVTGSAGKTTTKEFIYQILSHKYRAYRSFKNWNNWIGLPFSILNMSGKEEGAVFELAMSFPGIGEIDLLAHILEPDVAVILNVFPVHMEFLKTLENTAIAKCEILNHLKSDSVAFINADSEPIMKRHAIRSDHKARVKADGKPGERADDMPGRAGRKIFYSKAGVSVDQKQNPHAVIQLKEIIREGDRTRMKIDFYGLETEFVTPLVNRIHIENLFVAMLVAQHLGMKNHQIQEAIKHITPLEGRGSIYKHGAFTIIDETYNSNPEALKRTMQWVDQEYDVAKLAIAGDMLELGDQEEKYHREVGHYFATLKFQHLITVGELARHIATGAIEKGIPEKNIHCFDTAEKAGVFLKSLALKEAVLLFKASRGIKLEDAIKEFEND